MKNTLGLSLVFTAFLSFSAQASVLTPKMAKEFDNNIQLEVSATENVSGTSKTLTLTGEGLRKKKKAGINWSVYVGQVFMETPDNLKRTEADALASLQDVGMVAIQLTFLRNVAIGDMTDSFQDAFSANMTSTEQTTYTADMNAFVSMVNAGADAQNGQTMTLIGYKKADGTEVITYEDCAGKSQSMTSQAPGFLNKIYAIWYGNVAEGDDGLVNLHAWLLNVPSVTPATP